MEEMECWTDRSFDTIYKGLMRLNRLMPDHPLLGHKVVKFGPGGERLPEFQWMSVSEVIDTCQCFAAGCIHLNLVPEVDGEDQKKMRFIGL